MLLRHTIYMPNWHAIATHPVSQLGHVKWQLICGPILQCSCSGVGLCCWHDPVHVDIRAGHILAPGLNCSRVTGPGVSQRCLMSVFIKLGASASHRQTRYHSGMLDGEPVRPGDPARGCRGTACPRLPKDQVEQAFGVLPSSLRAQLLPFQRAGVRYGLAHQGRILLADEMGVGKTVQALALSACYQVCSSHNRNSADILQHWCTARLRAGTRGSGRVEHGLVSGLTSLCKMCPQS